jgi:hypothetical protein
METQAGFRWALDGDAQEGHGTLALVMPTHVKDKLLPRGDIPRLDGE